MSTHYMTGRWRVKAGQQDAFVRAWEELAMWSSMNVDGTGAARLLQSADDPGLFLGFWEFGGPGAIRDWRASPEVAERLAALGAMLDDAEPGEFELRAAVGD